MDLYRVVQSQGTPEAVTIKDKIVPMFDIYVYNAEFYMVPRAYLETSRKGIEFIFYIRQRHRVLDLLIRFHFSTLH